MDRFYHSQIETGCGIWHICATDAGVCSVQPGKGAEKNENLHSGRCAEELQRYFSGEPVAFTVPLDLQGTAFQKRVWQILRTIPYGETMSYGQIASELGSPYAARAVGQAVGRNPCLILVPCHRVVGKAGNLTGFSAGVSLKKRLLELERIDIK